MNRRVFLCAASAALTLFSLQALADPTVAPAGITLTDKDAEWVDGTNLLEVYGDDYTYHLEDLSGNVLTDSGYGSFYYSNGYITARLRNDELNSMGLVDQDGNLVIDTVYGDVKVINEHWAIGFTLTPATADNYDYQNFFSSDDGDQYFLIEKADVYFLSDTGAALAASLPRANYMDAHGYGEYISIQNRADSSITLYDSSWNVAQEGLSSIYSEPDIVTGEYEIFSDEHYNSGIRDKAGNVILEPVFDSISSIGHGYVLFYDEGFYGLSDLYGNIIIPAEADYVRTNYYAPETGSEEAVYPAGSYVAFERDNKLGYYDLDGNLTMPATYSSDSLDLCGASAVLTNPDGSKVLLAADGVETPLDEAHSDLRALSYASGFLYTFDTEDYKTGLMDWHGNELLPAQYNSIRTSGDGKYLLVGIDYDNIEVYQVTYDEQVPNDAEGLISEGGSVTVTDTSSQAQDGEITIQGETEQNVVTDEYEVTDEAFVLDDDTIVSEGEGTGAVDFSAVKTLLTNAVSLAQQDLESNASAIQALLDSASSLTASDYPQISILIDSATSLITSGAATSDTLITVINSAISALG